MDSFLSPLSIDGHSNFTVGKNLNFNLISIEKDGSPKTISFADAFHLIDSDYKNRVEKDGTVERGSKRIEFSSRELFTSLMRIGIPFEPAFEIPFQIVEVLVEMKDEISKDHVRTSDIRVAVVRCINCLSYRFSTEEVDMWSAAYIRRYGNPDNEFIRVVDNDSDKELSYSYLQEKFLPHLFGRILGMGKEQQSERFEDPLIKFSSIFSTATINLMSKEIVRSLNSLNLYIIRYKTLLYLVEDLILEPPHPWIVNEQTMESVFKYNLDRAHHHHHILESEAAKKNQAMFNQSAKECFMHYCAAILSYYGAFLGVGTKYGFFEFRRILKSKDKNPTVWQYCRINQIQSDLERKSLNFNSVISEIEKIKINLSKNDSEEKFESLKKSANSISFLVKELCN